MSYKDIYDEWLNSDFIDEKSKDELLNIKDEKEIEDRFYKNLGFGTAGLRGKMACGTNRMNVYTVGRTTQGFANYLKSEFANPDIAIAYDSRNMSKEFADVCAKVLSANDIKVYLYESLRPTPILSFAVRELKLCGGIVITASHNPKEYNGYKIYGSDGSQINQDLADKILNCINSIRDFSEVKEISLKEAEEKGKLKYIGEDLDNIYYEKVKELVINEELVSKHAQDLKVIYTPIHGSGNIPVRAMLEKLGYKNVEVVKEQEKPDGNFSTVSYPNPENPDVFDLAVNMASNKETDIIIGTDPDCDRIGVLAKNKNNEFEILSGNQIGVLLTDYILKSRKENNIITSKDTIVKTIVTSVLTDEVAKSYGAKIVNVLTGFKYIGEKIEEFNKLKSNNFVLGFEESYGYLCGDFVRDKDAVIASVLILEMALFYKTHGRTLLDALDDLYKSYGYYKESQFSITMDGKEGLEKIENIISTLRNNMPIFVGDAKIVEIHDYELSKKIDRNSKSIEVIELPKSNVIKIVLEDGSWFVVRPSGTEPKIKIYTSVICVTKEKVENKSQLFIKNIKELLTKCTN